MLNWLRRPEHHCLESSIKRQKTELPLKANPNVSKCVRWSRLHFGTDHHFVFVPRPLKVELRDIHDETEELVEKFLRNHFKQESVVYPSDVVAALNLDYDQVVKIFDKFVQEGKLVE